MRNQQFKNPSINIKDASFKNENLYCNFNGNRTYIGCLVISNNGMYYPRFSDVIYTYDTITVSNQFETESGIIFKSIKLKNVIIKNLIKQTY